jgi:Domain of unknown function (DUF1772)
MSPTMMEAFQIAAVLLVVVALVPMLAHALELPGKMRLDEDAYRRVQPIYYPGFTVAAGIGEAGGMLGLAALLLVTRPGSGDFWLTLTALALLAVAHGVYWIVTHPVNRVWVRGEKLGRLGTGFFAVGQRGESPRDRWTALRNRWEYSHVARAVLAFGSLVALLAALA